MYQVPSQIRDFLRGSIDTLTDGESIFYYSTKVMHQTTLTELYMISRVTLEWYGLLTNLIEFPDLGTRGPCGVSLINFILCPWLSPSLLQ